MKRYPGIIILFLWLQVGVHAQSSESPVDHMTSLDKLEENLSKKYLSYMSEVAHGRRARKMEKRRNDLLTSINEAIREGSKLRPYKGDASLREAFKEYWIVLLTIFKEDYHKIVDMEEVAEQSYDAMEEYLLIQEKASEKLHDAHDKIPKAYEAFAAKHNVRLVEGQSSKLSQRLSQAGQVNSYMNKIFLIYFKSNVQEGLMVKAMENNDVSSVEQSKNSLGRYAVEGLATLDTLKPFKGDGSLINACRKLLEFQKEEAESKADFMPEFLIKKEEFEKIKKAFDAKPANKRTQGEIDDYNKAIADYNKAITDYNKSSAALNTEREKAFNNWETARKRFLDVHVPHKL